VSDLSKLEAALKELPTYRAPAGWRDRVFAAIDAEAAPREIRRPSSRVWWIAGGGLLAAAAVALYLVIPGPRREPAIAMEVQRASPGDPQRDRSLARPGDTLVIRAKAGDAFRVYRDRVQIARCPGHAGCTRTRDELALALPVAEAGMIVTIIYRPALPEPEPGWTPSAADQDADLARATSLGIAMKMSEAIAFTDER
jgi:hypothetical protein